MSAGKTLILEKTDGFTPQDVEEHLAVLLLMLGLFVCLCPDDADQPAFQDRHDAVVHDLEMNRMPKKIEVRKTMTKAIRMDNSQFEINLFEPMDADSFNGLEREVASFLDEQSQLYFWYRNIPHHGYYVQGWQKPKIYADFIFTTHGTNAKEDYRKVFVLETKGLHLKNPDTEYKRSVFALCNKHAKLKTWNQLVPAMRDKQISYEIVFQPEWQKRLNELLAGD